ncbi:uncharacterized protein LOC129582479 [Paramacrobiotus metropolitanus]|uniref:uncharacterized protein LOC129582479 n=1 Tax=Paramacrobiotus metropolitanus TaxID=2943436 RepID=UPI0024458756|nr:uncharacterized protein LOC129582479 [Paramacrobiotus metropolitanus]
MPRETAPEAKASVVALLSEGLSLRKIQERLLTLGIVISKSTVSNISHEQKRIAAGWTKPAKRLGAQNLPSSRTKPVIAKVKKAVSRQNPETQTRIAKRLGIARSTMQKILSENLQLKRRKKRKVHVLTEKQKQQRYDRGKVFISYLGMFKVRMIFTMDETWVTLDDFNVQTDFYYAGGEMEVPDDWKKKPTKRWPQKVMIAVGICWNGMSRAYCVDGKAKVDAKYFVNEILSKMVNYDIPRLYGAHAKDVILHFDNARSHTAKVTQQWLKSNEVKYVPQEHWMANSPDLSRLDYGISGIFKQIFGGRKATTVGGLSRIVKQVCSSFDLSVIRNTLQSWNPRVQKMLDTFGDHVEI